MLPVPANARRSQVVCLPFIKKTGLPIKMARAAFLPVQASSPSVCPPASRPLPPVTPLTLLLVFLLRQLLQAQGKGLPGGGPAGLQATPSSRLQISLMTLELWSPPPSSFGPISIGPKFLF